MLEGSAFGLKHIFLDLPGILPSFPVGAWRISMPFSSETGNERGHFLAAGGMKRVPSNVGVMMGMQMQERNMGDDLKPSETGNESNAVDATK